MSEITMDLRLVFTVPESGLKINGLIRGLKDAAPQIHATILSTLMKALEDRVIGQILNRDPQRYRRNGHQSKPRRLKTSLGEVSYSLAQIRDLKTGRTLMPLVRALSLPAHDHYLEEALEPAVGLAIHVSFRRAVGEVERIQGPSISPSTVHSRLQEFAQTHDPLGDFRDTPFRFLLVDGTKVHLQGPRGKDLGQAEMRWALASLGSGARFEPVGFWIDTSWPQIRKDLGQRLHYRKLKVLFSDGGPGIEENLLHGGMEHQRCQWHGKREFPYVLYADGIKKTEQILFTEKLASLPAMNLSKAQMEALRPEDRPRVEQIVKETERGFQELLKALDPGKYPHARVYIQNLIQPVMTFLSWWLKKGETIPLNTNAIESAFSQVCNRIKKVGRRWSQKGLLNWLKVTFYKIFKPDLWNKVWDNGKKAPKIRLISIQASYAWSGSIT